MLVFNNNGVMTDTWVLFDIDSMKCTAWATYRVMEYGNGTYVDMNFTHIVGACDTMTFKSGSMELDVRDTNHILYGDASFTRVQRRTHLRLFGTGRSGDDELRSGRNRRPRNACGDTALILAARRGCKDGVAAFIGQGANVNARNADGGAALIVRPPVAIPRPP